MCPSFGQFLSGQAEDSQPDNPLLDLGGLVGAARQCRQHHPARLDVVDLRVPIVVGFGMGAFAAGAAYPKIVQDLKYQPGGANSPTKATDPLLGSITILPMLLLRNPGRANGGLFARAYPFARLFGIDTLTPDTEVTSSGGVPIRHRPVFGRSESHPDQGRRHGRVRPALRFRRVAQPVLNRQQLDGIPAPDVHPAPRRHVEPDPPALDAAHGHSRQDRHRSVGAQPVPHAAREQPAATRTALPADRSDESADPRCVPKSVGHVGKRALAGTHQPRQPWLHRRQENARRHLHPHARPGAAPLLVETGGDPQTPCSRKTPRKSRKPRSPPSRPARVRRRNRRDRPRRPSRARWAASSVE